jgi:hypothetical protein
MSMSIHERLTDLDEALKFIARCVNDLQGKLEVAETERDAWRRWCLDAEARLPIAGLDARGGEGCGEAVRGQDTDCPVAPRQPNLHRRGDQGDAGQGHGEGAEVHEAGAGSAAPGQRED